LHGFGLLQVKEQLLLLAKEVAGKEASTTTPATAVKVTPKDPAYAIKTRDQVHVQGQDTGTLGHAFVQLVHQHQLCASCNLSVCLKKMHLDCCCTAVHARKTCQLICQQNVNDIAQIEHRMNAVCVRTSYFWCPGF